MQEGDRPQSALACHFASLKDPRIEQTKRHYLLEIIAIALCGII